MKTCELPEEYCDVMVTYMKTFYSGPYGDASELRKVTKRGFFSKMFGYFSIPPEYRYFNGSYLPHGFGGDKVKIEDVINWKYCENNKD